MQAVPHLYFPGTLPPFNHATPFHYRLAPLLFSYLWGKCTPVINICILSLMIGPWLHCSITHDIHVRPMVTLFNYPWHHVHSLTKLMNHDCQAGSYCIIHFQHYYHTILSVLSYLIIVYHITPQTNTMVYWYHGISNTGAHSMGLLITFATFYFSFSFKPKAVGFFHLLTLIDTGVLSTWVFWWHFVTLALLDLRQSAIIFHFI